MELDELIEIYKDASNFLHYAIACDGCPIELCRKLHDSTLMYLEELKAYHDMHEADERLLNSDWGEMEVRE